MTAVTANLEIFAAASVLGLGLLLFVVGVISWARLRSPRALLVSLGFLVLAIKGTYLTLVSWDTRGSEAWVLPVASLDLLLGLFLYFATRKP